MTAVFSKRLSSSSHRLQSICAMTRQRLARKRQSQFDQIQKRVLKCESNDAVAWACSINDVTASAEYLADVWKRQCQSAGIGVGLFSWFFWNFFLPILIQLAKDWLEEMAEETSQVTISGVAMGAATNTGPS